MEARRCSVIRADDAKAFNEGDEECREYVRLPGFWVGTSRLAPGARGDVDPGHDQHVELFLVVSGAASIDTGGDVYQLNEGDALFIPPTVAHTLHNEGPNEAVLVWAAGPPEKA